MRFGHIMALDEDSADAAAGVQDGLIGQIDEALLQRPVGYALQFDGYGATDEGLTGGVDAIQLVQKALRHHLGQHIGEYLADDLAMSDQLVIGIVGEFEYMLGATQDADETGCLLEQLVEALALGLEQTEQIQGQRLHRIAGICLGQLLAQQNQFGDVQRLAENRRYRPGIIQQRGMGGRPVFMGKRGMGGQMIFEQGNLVRRRAAQYLLK